MIVKSSEAVAALVKTLVVLALNDFLISLPEAGDFAKVSCVQAWGTEGLLSFACYCFHCLISCVHGPVGFTLSLMFPIVLSIGESSCICAWWSCGDYGARV